MSVEVKSSCLVKSESSDKSECPVHSSEKIHRDHKSNCRDREFLQKSNLLRSRIGHIQYNKGESIKKHSSDDKKYANHHYNGSFHKGLAHNLIDGRLINPKDYRKMRSAIHHNDLVALSKIQMAGSLKLANPTAAWASILTGAPQSTLKFAKTPKMSSKSTAAEMIELYNMVLARDIPFNEYHTNSLIAQILDQDHMNKSDIIKCLKYMNKPSQPFTSQTIFRGLTDSEQVGPYISQLLLLPVRMGAGEFVQKYNTLPARQGAVKRVEWGVDLKEMIRIQNGDLSTLPQAEPMVRKYIFCGRGLAEAVHNDPAYQFYYQGALILNSLGCPTNPDFPVYANQSAFITGPALPNVLCAIGAVADLCLKHAWYWKWQAYRRLRPEQLSVWVHDVKKNILPNKNNFDLSDVLLENIVLEQIEDLYGNYTIPLTYPEGCPVHPSYPAGHSVCAGACSTIMKMYYDCSKKWHTLTQPVQSIDGDSLTPYTDADHNEITVLSEIDKLCSNVSLGRSWSSVHYRSDDIEGMLLGEQIAIAWMADNLSSTVENWLDGKIPKISFTKFDGTTHIVTPSICH
jgi:hypothetical protein